MQKDEIHVREQSPLVRRDEADRLELLEKYLISAGALVCGKDNGRAQEELRIADISPEFAVPLPQVGFSEAPVQSGSFRDRLLENGRRGVAKPRAEGVPVAAIIGFVWPFDNKLLNGDGERFIQERVKRRSMERLRLNKLLHQREMFTSLRRFVQVMSQLMNTHRRDAIRSGRVGYFHEAVVGDEGTTRSVRFWFGARNDVDIEFASGRIGFDETCHLADERRHVAASQDFLNWPNASFHCVATGGLPPGLEPPRSDEHTSELQS